ncbi:MAG: hypothetical protein J6C93_01870 [Clostridia bacterium]|nr:hypothetical protein [Clostridia bacterium]
MKNKKLKGGKRSFEDAAARRRKLILIAFNVLFFLVLYPFYFEQQYLMRLTWSNHLFLWFCIATSTVCLQSSIVYFLAVVADALKVPPENEKDTFDFLTE